MVHFKKSYPLVALALAFLPLVAGAVPNDFNGDGKSDPGAYSGDDYNWQSWQNGSLNTIVNSFGTGKIGVVSGSYLDNGKSQVGYVDKEGTWHIYNGESEQTFEHKGGKLATYLAGADVDGDGKDDAIFVTNRCSSKKASVRVLRDPLGDAEFLRVRAGKGNFMTMFADINGDSFDDICWLQPIGNRKGLTGRFKLRCRDVVTRTNFTPVKLGVVQAQPLPVARSGNPNLSDYIAIPRAANGKTIVKVLDSNGTEVTKITFDITGEVVIGRYVDAPANGEGQTIEQIGVASNGVMHVYDFANDEITKNVKTPAGTIFDEVNIQQFVTKNEKCLCNTAKIKRLGFCPVANGCDVTQDFLDGQGNLLHKPVSDSTGSIVNLLPSNMSVSNCWYSDKKGRKVRDAQTTGRTNGNRPTWRPIGGGRCSSFPDNLVFSCQVDKKRYCWKIPDPCNRYD